MNDVRYEEFDGPTRFSLDQNLGTILNALPVGLHGLQNFFLPAKRTRARS